MLPNTSKHQQIIIYFTSLINARVFGVEGHCLQWHYTLWRPQATHSSSSINPKLHSKLGSIHNL